MIQKTENTPEGDTVALVVRDDANGLKEILMNKSVSWI